MKTTNVFNRKRVVAINSDVNDKFMPDLTLPQIKKFLEKYVIVEMKPSVVGEGQDKLKIVYIEAKHHQESVIIMVQVFDEENTKDIISALKLGAGVSQVMLSNPFSKEESKMMNKKLLYDFRTGFIDLLVLSSIESIHRGRPTIPPTLSLITRKIFDEVYFDADASYSDNILLFKVIRSVEKLKKLGLVNPIPTKHKGRTAYLLTDEGEDFFVLMLVEARRLTSIALEK